MATLAPNGAKKGPGGTKKLVIKPLTSEQSVGLEVCFPNPLLLSSSAPYVLRTVPNDRHGRSYTTYAEQPKLPANFEADTWAKLEDAVDAVHCKRTVSCSLEELYRVSRSIRDAEHSAPIYTMQSQRRGLASDRSRAGAALRCAALRTLCSTAPRLIAGLFPATSPHHRPWRTCAPTRCRTTCTSGCRRRATPTSAEPWARCRSRCVRCPAVPSRSHNGPTPTAVQPLPCCPDSTSSSTPARQPIPSP